MNNLNQYIIEKLKLNKDIKLKNQILSTIIDLLNSNKEHNIDNETEKIFADWIEDKHINKLKILSYEYVFDELYGNHKEIVDEFTNSDIEFHFLNRDYMFLLEDEIYKHEDKKYYLFSNKDKKYIIYSVPNLGNISFQIKD